MNRSVRRFLLAWLGLLGGLVLSQQLPFPGSGRVGYWLMAGVACGSPVVAILLLREVVLGLRDAFRRIQVLRRAVKWRRERPPSNEWLGLDE